MRPVDQMFHRYSEFHRNGTNKAIHWVCVPLILWSVIGLLWVASPILTGVAIAASLAFYLWLSRPLALGMAAVVGLMIYAAILLGSRLLMVSATVFVASWIGQFVGHNFEGRKPAFLDDVRSLLIGPAWVLGFLYRRLGIRF